MKKMIALCVVGLAFASSAQAQDAQIAAVLGEAQALEEINTLCPQVYSDVAVIDASEDRVWAYATQVYGADAERMITSDAMEQAVRNAAYDTLLAFEKSAGGKDKLCAYAESGAIRGVTKLHPDQQPESVSAQDQPGYASAPDPAPAELPPLVPEW